MDPTPMNTNNLNVTHPIHPSVLLNQRCVCRSPFHGDILWKGLFIFESCARVKPKVHKFTFFLQKYFKKAKNFAFEMCLSRLPVTHLTLTNVFS